MQANWPAARADGYDITATNFDSRVRDMASKIRTLRDVLLKGDLREASTETDEADRRAREADQSEAPA